MVIRILLAGIVTGIICFFPSALIYGGLSEYIQANTTHYEGLFKHPPLGVEQMLAGWDL